MMTELTPDPLPRLIWRKPQLTRYLLPAADIAMYQIASGPVASFQCVNPDLCTGGEGASLPPWLIPG